MTKKASNENKWSFSSHVDTVSAALSRVLGAVDKRSTIPILANIKLDVLLRGAVQFVATDLEVRAVTEFKADIPGAGGDACVPAELLKGVLSRLHGDVTFTLHNDMRLVIEGGDRHFEIACFPACEFPDPDCHWGPAVCHFAPGILPRLLRSVNHAMCQDHQKNNLCGVYLCQEDGRLTAVATDGNRLSISGLGVDGVNLLSGFLIPSKAVRILSGIETGICVYTEDEAGGSQVYFEAGGFDLTVRLIGGDFPAYRRVVPSDHDQFFNVEASSLAEAIEDVAVVNEGKSKSVSIEAPESLHGEGLEVSALGANGVAKASVPCIGGEGYRLMANSSYLVKALKAFDGEIFIKYGGDSPAMLLVPVDHTGFDERLEVVMPYRSPQTKCD